MQTQGSLQEANLASLLQTMQSERATGTLTLENGPSSCSLYFLFGHLFHASDPARQGEEVVVDALTWADGSFHFDPRAKLPAEETIKSSPADLIAEAEQRSGATTATAPAPEPAPAPAAVPAEAAPAAAEAAPAETWSPAPAAEAAATADAGWGATEATPTETYETPAATPQWQAEPEPAAAEPAPAWTPEPEPAVPAEAAGSPMPDYGTWAPAAETPAEAAAPAEPYSWEQPAAEAEPAATSWTAEPEAAPAAAEAPSWATPEPAPAAAAAPAATMAPVTPVPVEPPSVFYPLPSGKTTYEGLKSAFVDFPKLLRTLRSDNHTGYVRLNGEGFTGALVFQGGQLIEALADAGGSVTTGEAAFQQFRQSMDTGSGHLDVVDLSAELVSALGQLFSAPQMFHGLLGRFVDFDALIEYLEEQVVTGSVVITDSTELGVILLSEGKVLGAYTASQPAPDTKLTAVAALAKERTARIEVRSGAGAIPGIDVEAELARPL